jgi:hypothetical protein
VASRFGGNETPPADRIEAGFNGLDGNGKIYGGDAIDTIDGGPGADSTIPRASIAASTVSSRTARTASSADGRPGVRRIGLAEHRSSVRSAYACVKESKWL